MPNLNLYYSERETEFWKAARRVARKRGVSLSKVVIDAVQDALPRLDAEADSVPDNPWAHIAADAA